MRPKRKPPSKKEQKLSTRRPKKTLVQQYAESMGGSLEGIKAVAKEVKGFLVEATTLQESTHAYNDKSVIQILKDKRIPVLYGYKGFRKRPRWGCYTMSRVLYEILRVKGYKPKMVRYFLDGGGPLPAQKAFIDPSSKGASFKGVFSNGTNRGNPHTSIFFSFGKKIYNIDAFFPRVVLHEITPQMIEKLKELQQRGRFEYIKPGQISFEDFQKEKETGQV